MGAEAPQTDTEGAAPCTGRARISPSTRSRHPFVNRVSDIVPGAVICGAWD
jgi:hypothetical protein